MANPVLLNSSPQYIASALPRGPQAFNTDGFINTETPDQLNIRILQSSSQNENTDLIRLRLGLLNTIEETRRTSLLTSFGQTYRDLNRIRTLQGLVSEPTEVKSSGNAVVDETVQVLEAEQATNFIGPISPAGTDTQILEEAKGFKIKYNLVTGEEKYFAFNLLPAIESTLRGSNHGQTVPEVKPGILISPKMNYKKINIPGSASVYQSLGIDQVIMQLTGLFIGMEGFEDSVSPESILYNSPFGASGIVDNDPNTPVSGLPTSGRSVDLTRVNAITSAKSFMQDVVFSGSPVEISIISPQGRNEPLISLKYKVLIQGFRTFITRLDRVYYAIDALVVDTPVRRLKSSILENDGLRPLTTDEVSDLSVSTKPDGSRLPNAQELADLRLKVANNQLTLQQAALALGVTKSDSEVLSPAELQQVQGILDADPVQPTTPPTP